MGLEIRQWSGVVLEVRDAPQERLIEARVMTWDTPCDVGAYVETFAPDAFKQTLKKRGDRVKLLLHHDQTRPVGIANGWAPDEAGLVGRFRVSRTADGDIALEQARDGVLDVSIGFVPIPGGDQWSQDRRSVRRTAVELHEVSLVSLAAVDGAGVLSVRCQPSRLTEILDWLASARE
jgi:HK97 family phage prohead protease